MADAKEPFDATTWTHMACDNAREERLTNLRRLKCKKLLTGEERVAERSVFSIFFDTHVGERSVNGVDGLLAVLENKRLEVMMHSA
jgi:hypothetical protein